MTPAPEPRDDRTPARVDAARALWSKTGMAIASFWLLFGVAYLLPSPLSRLLRQKAEPLLSRPSMPTVQPSTPAGAAGAAAGEGIAAAGGSGGGGGQPDKASPHSGGKIEPIQGPERALAHFARALARTAAKEKGAITRVVHYGDSLIDLDHITAPLRRIYHRRYGDAGHGFALLAKPWPWYNQMGIVLHRGSGWVIHQLVGGSAADRRLGLGLVAVESPGGARSLRLRTTETVRFSRLEMQYLQRPGGGRVEVQADGKSLGSFSTGGPRAPGYKTLSLPDGPHTIKVRTRGAVRLFGAVLERDRPGVVWDNLPLVSARFHQLARADASHFKAQLAHRKPDLVVYQFGANDTLNYGGDLDRYGERIGVVLQRMHQALPRASCMVVGPLDRLQRVGGQLKSPGVVRRVSDKQRQVAIKHGCAFWDGQRAMGGPGAMKAWLAEGLALKDMVHLNPKGGARLARSLDRALQAAVGRLAKK